MQLPGSWLLRGGYQRLADRIRLTAELLDARTGRVEHAATLDGTMSELFALQDELSARLARAAALPAPRATPAPAGRAEVASHPIHAPVPMTNAGAGAAGSVAVRESSAVGTAAPAVSAGSSGSAGFAMPATIIHGPPPPIAPEVINRDAEGRATLRAIRLDAPLQLDGQLDERVFSPCRQSPTSSSRSRTKGRRRGIRPRSG